MQSQRLFFLNLFHETMEESCNLQFHYLMASMIIWKSYWRSCFTTRNIWVWLRKVLSRRHRSNSRTTKVRRWDESKLKDLRPKIIVFKRMINQPWSCQKTFEIICPINIKAPPRSNEHSCMSRVLHFINFGKTMLVFSWLTCFRDKRPNWSIIAVTQFIRPRDTS